MRTIHLPKGTIMPKQFWINIAIQVTVKVGAFLLIRKALADHLADLIERRPDLADMHNLK